MIVCPEACKGLQLYPTPVIEWQQHKSTVSAFAVILFLVQQQQASKTKPNP